MVCWTPRGASESREPPFAACLPCPVTERPEGNRKVQPLATQGGQNTSQLVIAGWQGAVLVGNRVGSQLTCSAQ